LKKEKGQPFQTLGKLRRILIKNKKETAVHLSKGKKRASSFSLKEIPTKPTFYYNYVKGQGQLSLIYTSYLINIHAI
jgi:hypothetical protein